MIPPVTAYQHMHPRITAGYRQRLLQCLGCCSEVMFRSPLLSPGSHRPRLALEFACILLSSSLHLQCFELGSIIAASAVFVNMQFPFHATTFLCIFLRFLYNLRSVMFALHVHSFALGAIDEYPSCLAVIARIPSFPPGNFFAFFSQNPLTFFHLCCIL